MNERTSHLDSAFHRQSFSSFSPSCSRARGGDRGTRNCYQQRLWIAILSFPFPIHHHHQHHEYEIVPTLSILHERCKGYFTYTTSGVSSPTVGWLGNNSNVSSSQINILQLLGDKGWPCLSLSLDSKSIAFSVSHSVEEEEARDGNGLGSGNGSQRASQEQNDSSNSAAVELIQSRSSSSSSIFLARNYPVSRASFHSGFTM